jgi:hypothetical protein
MPGDRIYEQYVKVRELGMLLQVHVLVLFVTQPKLLNVMVYMVVKNWMESLFILYLNPSYLRLRFLHILLS